MATENCARPDRYATAEDRVEALSDGTRTAAEVIEEICPRPVGPSEGDVRRAIWRLIADRRITLTDDLRLAHIGAVDA